MTLIVHGPLWIMDLWVWCMFPFGLDLWVQYVHVYPLWNQECGGIYRLVSPVHVSP